MHPLRHLAFAGAAFAVALAGVVATPAAAETVTIVALGDSLTAGYQLPPGAGFPAQLEGALKAEGLDVKVVDAGVSGDTTSGGLARLDWSVGEDADAVIVELGGNDALRGIDPARTRQNLTAILDRLEARGLPVLLAGMLAPPNLGEDYGDAFRAIYADLGSRDLVYYPFFLDGVAADPTLNLGDGIHPTAEGVGVIVEHILPKVKELVDRATTQEKT
ncbi:arylesterase [Acuticoccus mangrovi]|uniref:Arylesterase n=1 Tax=Acuticoccus mangrovi TaxID=2796142 RepID=A0A934IS28_9HYPH|nr:arylesterase [Acuticoccus mangrovi]